MEFVQNLTKEEFESFWSSTSINHFMQSYEWGQIQATTRGYEVYYVGLKDKKKVIAAAMLLKRNAPMHTCYFYSPRGFTIDFSNKHIVEEFTKGLKQFLKEQNAIYLKLDPPLLYQEIDIEGNKIEGGKNNYEVYNHLLSLGYKHGGFYKLYEGNQPRYTFRTYFNKYKNMDEIKKNISSSFTKQLKRSYNYDLEVYESNEIDTFYDLLKIVSSKDNFNEYPKSYYQTIYDTLKPNEYIKIFNAKINPSHIIDKLTKELEKEKLENRKAKIEKDIAYFKELPQTEKTIASLICIYSKKGAWSMYIGNDHTAEYIGAVNRLYYEFILDAYNRKFEYFDLFGVVGDPKTKYKNLGGIYEYKRKFGGEYIEFIGEFNLISKPFLYKVLPTILKGYRMIKKHGKK